MKMSAALSFNLHDTHVYIPSFIFCLKFFVIFMYYKSNQIY